MRDLPDTEQGFHPSQHDILCSVPRMSAINPLNAELNPICHLLALLGGATIVVVSRLRVKKTCLRAGREDDRGATRRRGRDFLFATVFRPGVRNTQTLTRGPYPVCKLVTHVHLVLKDKTSTLPLLVRTPFWHGAWLCTSRHAPFLQLL